MLYLSSSILEIGGVGPSTAIKLEQKGIRTISDLLLYFPIRYKDFTETSPIARLQPGDTVSIKARVLNCFSTNTKKRNLTIQRVMVEDDTKTITIQFFNQPYICNTLLKEHEYYFSGVVDKFAGKLAFKVAEYAPVKSTANIHTSTIVPYYSHVEKMTSRYIRTLMQNVIALLDTKSLQEDLPTQLVSKRSLLPLIQTITNLHHPQSKQVLAKARFRLVYEELFQLLLTNKRISKKRDTFTAPIIDIHKYDSFLKTLPFVLTRDQMAVLSETSADIIRGKPMNRLVIGDVGCGKTVVAAILAHALCNMGYTTIFLAPTSVLAHQHFETLTELFNDQDISVSLLTSHKQTTSVNSVQTAGISENTTILIATHALFFSKLQLKNVGLLIIDEQHKFGTQQREQLLEMTKVDGRIPHLLSLSATPIPRTLALTLYGSVDCSYIHTMPHKKASVITKCVVEANRNKAYMWTYNRIRQHKEQVFIVCPLIEDNENNPQSVEHVFQSIQKRFPDLTVQYIHGKLKYTERILSEFKKGTIDILVSTTVIEVGIDIPNATVMFVESAEQFGLAQLHQLRGRVGRGTKNGYCFLFSHNGNPSTYERLRIMEKSNDGFFLAQKDLELRGPGNLIGLQQKGFILHYAKDVLDVSLLESISADVDKVLANDPTFTYNSLIAPIETQSEDVQFLN